MSEGRVYPCIQQGKLPSDATCYACGKPATSIEHAPPRSWFATPTWCDPETVPSCEDHNEKVSPEVQLIGAIYAKLGRNECAKLVQERVQREISSRNGRVRQLFEREKDGIIPLLKDEILSHRKLFRGIGNALHYLVTGEQREHEWFILSPIVSSPLAEAMKTWVEGLMPGERWREENTRQPGCFRWWSGSVAGKFVYRLEFYASITVYLIDRSLPETAGEPDLTVTTTPA